MPFIHVRALPFDPPLDVPVVLSGLSRDFAEGTGVGLEHVTATWTRLEGGHYVVAGSVVERHGAGRPVLVDLFAPDANGPVRVERMLVVVAESLARRTGIGRDAVFVAYRPARSGAVFDAGEVVRW